MILGCGGSLGAEVLNRETLGLVDEMAGPDIKLYFITGKRYYEEIKARVDARGKEAPGLVLLSYADNMPELMCASDIVVSRAGAIAVSEITACGKPSVLVPSPNVTNNHQYYNAKAVADAGAALLLEEKDLPEGESRLAAEVLKLCADRQKLASMAENALRIGRTDAADVICRNIGI